jgi:RNA recognition motif-containing protein
MNISEQTPMAFEQQPNKVFIGGLSVNCEDSELSEFLEKFGPLTYVEVIKDSKTKAHKGYGFAVFVHKRDMQRAIGKNHVLKGKQFEIREFVDSNTNSEYLDRIAKRKIFISNIKEPLTEKDLSDFFTCFGAIEDLIISRDATTGLSKGFGFVIFIEEESRNKVLRDFGASGVRIKSYDLQVKGAIPKKDINRIKQAGVLGPHQEAQHGEVCQDFIRRQINFSERNPFLPSMMNLIVDPNPSPVSFIKEGLTPTTYMQSAGSPFTPNPGNKFSFTPEASPMSMVHQQFNFGQAPQHPLGMSDYPLVHAQPFAMHFQNPGLVPRNQSQLGWKQELGEPSSQLHAQFGSPLAGMQAFRAGQGPFYPSRNTSPVKACDSPLEERPKPIKKPSNLALRLDREDKSGTDLASLQLPKAPCLCSTEAVVGSDSTSLFTTLRKVRCSCGDSETQGAVKQKWPSNPANENEADSTLKRPCTSPRELKRLEKGRLDTEAVEYNHWQNIKVSKDKLERLRRRIESQEESQVSGLYGSPQDRDMASLKSFSHLDQAHH